MSAAELLQGLRQRGFVVSVDGYQLKVSPGAELSDDDREQIRLHRDSIVRLILDPDPRVKCADCGNWTGTRCVRYHRAGLMGPEVGPALAIMPQSCPAFVAVMLTSAEAAA